MRSPPLRSEDPRGPPFRTLALPEKKRCSLRFLLRAPICLLKVFLFLVFFAGSLRFLDFVKVSRKFLSFSSTEETLSSLALVPILKEATARTPPRVDHPPLCDPPARRWFSLVKRVFFCRPFPGPAVFDRLRLE